MREPLVVVGDAMLDIDVEGRAARLCPDAPVPVVDGAREHPRPGGAALAAAMAAADGFDVVLVAPWADDAEGRQLRDLLEPKVRVIAIPDAGATSVKRRIRAGGQTLVRLDSGAPTSSVEELPSEVGDVLRAAGAVLVADYGRGLTALPQLRSLISRRTRDVPVVWDPHPRGHAPVAGVHLVTPNAGEAIGWAEREGARVDHPTAALATLTACASHLVTAWRSRAVAVTRGERGALLSYGSGAPALFPAPAVAVGDACGAGDRFAAAAIGALARGMVTAEAVQWAVDAASAHVATGGAAGFARGDHAPARQDEARPDADRVIAAVRATGGTVVATGGCFDLLHAGHIATLRAARDLGDCLVVCLNSDDSVHRLKGPGRPLVPAQDRVRVLLALECVDAVVVFDEDTPETVLRRLRPDVWAKGGDYAGSELPEAAALRSWGGQAVVLPYVEGRSTTSLVRTAAGVHTNP